MRSLSKITRSGAWSKPELRPLDYWSRTYPITPRPRRPPVPGAHFTAPVHLLSMAGDVGDGCSSPQGPPASTGHVSVRSIVVGIGINEDCPDENTQGHLFRAGHSRGLSHHHLRLGRDSQAGGERERFLVAEGEGSGLPDWRLLACESQRPNQKWGGLQPACSLGEHSCLSLGLISGKQGVDEGGWQLPIKARPLGP